ncbi:MAG: hypothetical protein EA402_10515 [Planctomycetota bacterium]|nr:MAG: hypothetical protein EA402_10515 [Planctomycetota bacterium]
MADPALPDYALDDRKLLERCELQRSTGGGPGGQHANRTRSRVVLRHRGTGLQAEAGESRDGLRNQRQALQRLRLRLALSQRGFSDRAWLTPFRPAAGRLRINPGHAQFPLLVACCIDALEASAWHLPTAAASLDCSGSQMLKLLASDKAVWQWLHERCQERGMPMWKSP